MKCTCEAGENQKFKHRVATILYLNRLEFKNNKIVRKMFINSISLICIRRYFTN